MNRSEDKCDWACENQPCEYKKISNFFAFALSKTIYTSKIKSLSLLQNLMGCLLKFMEMGYHIQS